MPIDLTGKSFNIAQSLIDRGQPLNLDFSVINNGDEDVAPFSFDIVISRDGTISQNDYVLGNYEIRTGLKAGEDSGIKTYRYFTPPENSSFWQTGDDNYTVGIRLDPNNQVFESNEDNNSNVRAGVDSDVVQVVDFGVAELKGTFTDVGKSGIVPGERVDLTFTIANDSPQIANPFSVDIYLSPDKGSETEGAVKLGTYDIRESISGNGEITKKFNYPTPDLGHPIWEQGDGEYYITLDIDSKNEVEESNEENNSGLGDNLDQTSFNVTGLNSAADLVVKNLEIPENSQAGETIEIKYEIVNEGESPAELFAAGFYLFNESYLTPDRESLDIEDVPEVFFIQGNNSTIIGQSSDNPTGTLAAESSTGVITTQITLPETWGGYSGNGDYYLGVEADPFDDVVESSDANNSLEGVGIDYQKIALEAPNLNTVDLVGTHFEVVQDRIVPGQEFDLGFNIKNEGLAETGAFSFDLYLSEDATITTDDRYLGTYDIREGLAGNKDISLKDENGNSVPRSVRYTAPPLESDFWGDADGTYYAGMIIDPASDTNPNGRVVESNEDNNSNQGNSLDYASVQVTGLEKIAELYVSSFDVVEEEIALGDTFTVNYTVVNDGDQTADFSGAGFFIFHEDYLLNNDNLSIDDVPQVFFLAGNSQDFLIENLEGGTSREISTELVMPENWAGFVGGSGKYYIGAAADVYDDVEELNEINNSLVGAGLDYEKVTINIPQLEI